jgi:UDP-3-O-[3-hydroxymyristoyl] glucosamine N-acyltransferase
MAIHLRRDQGAPIAAANTALHRCAAIEYGRTRMNPFFPQPAGLTVREIGELTGAVVRSGGRLDIVISGIAALEQARPFDLTFIDSVKYADHLAATRAGVCMATERFAEQAPAALTVLVTANPFRDFVTVARRLYPDSLRPRSLFEAAGGAAGAMVHPTAEIEDGVIIDPGAVIGPRAAIGTGTVIAATTVIGPDVQIGRDCSIGPGASIVHALIGDNVILHAGCRIGQDGFRYRTTGQGHIKVPQVGRVIVQDNVEIGANTAIDRGGSGDTVIGEGTKIDNLVQIGHNCMVGRNCIIVSQCGLSGSVVLGDHVVLGGQVGIADHLIVGEGAFIGAKSGVADNIPAGERWIGAPAMPAREFFRAVARMRKLA